MNRVPKSQRPRRPPIPENTLSSSSIKYDQKTCTFSQNSRSLNGICRVYLNKNETLIGEFTSGKLKNAKITSGTKTLNMEIDDDGIVTIMEESVFGGLSYQFKLENINGTTTYDLPKQNSKHYTEETTINSTQCAYVPADDAIVKVKRCFLANNTFVHMSGKYSGLPNKPFGRCLNSLQIYVGRTLSLAAAEGYPITINDKGEMVRHCRLSTIDPNCQIIEKSLLERGGLLANMIVCMSDKFTAPYYYLLDVSSEASRSRIITTKYNIMLRITDSLLGFSSDSVKALFLPYPNNMLYLIFNSDNIEKSAIDVGHPACLYTFTEDSKSRGKGNDYHHLYGVLCIHRHISGMIEYANMQNHAKKRFEIYCSILKIPILSNTERSYILIQIGLCYATGDKTFRSNLKTALNYYQEAINFPDLSEAEVDLVSIRIGHCYETGDENLPIDFKMAIFYFAKSSKLHRDVKLILEETHKEIDKNGNFNNIPTAWRSFSNEQKTAVINHCSDNRLMAPLMVFCCFELKLQERDILARGELQPFIKNVMNIIIVKNIGIIKSETKIYTSLPDIIKKHNYDCPISLTIFHTELDADLEKLEVIIFANPNGHLTIYQYVEFGNAISKHQNHPGMLESIMFLVDSRFVKKNAADTPVYSIDLTNPTPEKIFWWYFKKRSTLQLNISQR